MKSVSERLRVIEKALNEAKHAASWISTYNGARNPDESLHHAQLLSLAASDLHDQAAKLEKHFAAQLLRKQQKEGR